MLISQQILLKGLEVPPQARRPEEVRCAVVQNDHATPWILLALEPLTMVLQRAGAIRGPGPWRSA